MKLEIEVHPAQAEILNTLLFHKKARFSEMNKTDLTNDHFTFHIKRLVELGMVLKNEDETYSLSKIGKEFANRFDTEEKIVEKQAKIAVLLVAVHNKHKGTYLTQQRLKQPYYGFWGWPTGKIRWGEDVTETGGRELQEETGLTGDLKWMGVWHKRDYEKKTGKLLEDKYFYIVRADKLKGELLEKFDGGENRWQTLSQLLKQEKVFESVEKAVEIAEGSTFTSFEQQCYYDDEEY